MKNISQIINLLKSKNEFVKLKNIEKFDRLYKILPPTIASGIEFMYTKNETLFFVLKHPLFKAECEYNRVTLKKLLTLMPEIGATNIQFIVTNRPKKKSPQDINQPNTYEEPSKGRFLNLCQDKEWHESFELIRDAIFANRSAQ